MLANILTDLRYALRMLRKSPAFTVVAILVIALGSGAVTTIFSAANAVILRPIPGAADPGQLVEIGRTQGDGHGSLTPSYPFYSHVRDESHALRGVAAWDLIPLTVSTGAEGTSALGNLASANYFEVLGVRPALGRFFSPDEGRTPGAHPVIVLSHGFWQRRFGGDSGVVGRSVIVNGSPYTVIGVAPKGFTGVYPVIRTDAWVPLMQAEALGRGDGILASAGSGWLIMFGRLNDGVTIDRVRAELVAISAAHRSEEPEDMQLFTGVALSRVTGFPSDASGAIYAFVALLFAMSALVLVIASVNVAGMLLARATTRRREMAVRIALGAGRGRLVSQMLTESLVLFVAGAGGGLLIAFGSVRLFDTIQLPAELPIAVDLAPDYRVLIFALGAALITGIVFGLAPALQATRSDPSVSLRSDSAGAGTRRSRTRNALVIGQMALSLVLLVCAGLFVRALGRGQRVDPGFDRGGVATAPVAVSTSGYNETRARTFYDVLAARLSAAPGVTAVAYARMLPLTNSRSSMAMTVDGYEPPRAESRRGQVDIDFAIVSPGFLDVLRIPLVRGRDLLASDGESAAHVAVVNETFAKHFWPGKDPIGRTLHDGKITVTIVGVARDAKYSSLNEAPMPYIYLPLAQNWRPEVNLLVRTTGDAAALTPVIRDAVRATDPLLPVPAVLTMEAATSVALLPQRVAAAVTAVMGLLGLLLATAGLYGVIAYSVSQRTREIGVRMALGADRANVMRLVLRDGVRIIAIGLAIGLALSAAAARAMTPFLFGVSATDALVFAIVPVALGAVALLASYVPARRAASTDPLTALRAE
jgi:predicted permease